jgi:hypothetical protein
MDYIAHIELQKFLASQSIQHYELRRETYTLINDVEGVTTAQNYSVGGVYNVQSNPRIRIDLKASIFMLTHVSMNLLGFDYDSFLRIRSANQDINFSLAENTQILNYNNNFGVLLEGRTTKFYTNSFEVKYNIPQARNCIYTFGGLIIETPRR